MTIRNTNGNHSYNRRKADQHWDMAGLARQDNDMKEAERHTQLAREYEAKVREEG